MKKFLFCILLGFATTSFALTPFSLENLKSVNFKIVDKQKLLDEKVKEALSNQIQKKLLAQNIQSTSKNFANFLIKFQTFKVGEKTFCTTSLFLIEDVNIKRDKPTTAIAITYMKQDSFEVENFSEDVSESVEYLVDDFLAQHEEEN